jgi:biopolymer transport protein ExbD
MAVIFLILAIFLLPVFSASIGVHTRRPSNIDLPIATHCQPLEPGPVISIGGGYVSIQGARVACFDDLSEDPHPYIKDLAERLIQLEKNRRALYPHRKHFPGLIIEADRQVPFLVLRKVIHTATAVGFPRFQLAVKG